MSTLATALVGSSGKQLQVSSWIWARWAKRKYIARTSTRLVIRFRSMNIIVSRSRSAATGTYSLWTGRAHRLSQAWELARMVNASAEKGRHVFVVRRSLLYRRKADSLIVRRPEFNTSIPHTATAHIAWKSDRRLDNDQPSPRILRTLTRRVDLLKWRDM